MRLKRIGLVMAMVALTALLGLPSALGHGVGHNADPAPPPVPGVTKAACVVQGSVSGLSVTHRPDLENAAGAVGGNDLGHNHFSFVDTSIRCASADPKLSGDPDPLALDPLGRFTPVTVSNGNVDGPDHTPAAHGEDCNQGWSWDAAILHVKKANGANAGDNSTAGSVKFTRRGSVVDAWGSFTLSGTTFNFNTVLNFTPTDAALNPVPATVKAACVDDPPTAAITNARLDGEAVIW